MDEIAILVQGMKDKMQDICKQYPNAQEYSLSGGFTLFIADDTLDNALQRADFLLYQAKEAGRNRITSNLRGDSQ